MKKRLFVMVIICMVFIGFNTRVPQAAEVDILINKLVEKRIITQDEATQLMDEMRKEGARENEAIKAVVAEAAKEEAKNNKQVLPSWISSMTLSGDLRVRYQTEDIDDDGKPSRNRWRIRLRPALDAKINEQWKIGFGLATGSDDPISTNQTLENEFQSPDIRLDYAYAQYSPTKDIKIIAGKVKNPLYTTKDLMWDSDARPDGLAATFNFKASDKIGFFITPAYFILEEFSSADDPAMIAFQPGMTWKINDNVNFKIAGTYYDFKNVKGSNMSAHSQGTNSTDAGGLWLFDHDSTAFDAELGFNIPSFGKYASLFGEYVKSDADADNTGWLAGVTFGDEKVNELGKWQFIYNYRNIEKDAWVDWLPDSDFYGGETGTKGSEFEFTFGVAKNITLGLDYYLCQPIDNPNNRDMSLLQADLVIKF